MADQYDRMTRDELMEAIRHKDDHIDELGAILDRVQARGRNGPREARRIADVVKRALAALNLQR